MRARAVVLSIALVACRGKKPPVAELDPEAICAGRSQPRDVIVLHAGDTATSGKARGLIELASRAPRDNAGVRDELERFAAASDGQVIFQAHVEERERRVREDLAIAQSIVEVIHAAAVRESKPPDQPFGVEGGIRFPPIAARGSAIDLHAKVDELQKPLQDGSATHAVVERAAALSTALADLAKKVAALDTSPSLEDSDAQVSDAIKIANVASGKLNEATLALHTTVSTLAAHADELDGRLFASYVRLWSRLAVITTRIAAPFPPSVLTRRHLALMIAGPRQWVVTCAAPKPLSLPPAILAAIKPMTGARDALTATLGYAPVPASPAPAPTLDALRSALTAANQP